MMMEESATKLKVSRKMQSYIEDSIDKETSDWLLDKAELDESKSLQSWWVVGSCDKMLMLHVYRAIVHGSVLRKRDKQHWR